MGNDLVRRRNADRLAVHREVGSGQAELVPDIDRPGSWLLFVDGVPQSQVDLDDPGYLEFEYVRRIGHVIDLGFPAGEPLRALHLGGGALTLPRYIAHTRPGSAQLVAEIDTALTDLVREHLPVPQGGRGTGQGARGAGAPRSQGGSGGDRSPRGNNRSPRRNRGRIRVRAADAREVLESVPEGSYDLVISDVYAGAKTPFHLTTAECLRAAARALRPGGIYISNVADGAPQKGIRGAVATGRSVYQETLVVAEPAILRGRRLGNFVLAAGDQPLPADDLRRRVASDPFPARVVDGTDLARFAASAPVITDASAPDTASPQPTNW
jgi:spermidine synthase